MLSAKKKTLKKEKQHIFARGYSLLKKKVDFLFLFFKSRSFALSVAVENPIAVRRRLLQLVVFEAVEGGRVALGGGAEQLLRSSEGPVLLLLSSVSCAGREGG